MQTTLTFLGDLPTLPASSHTILVAGWVSILEDTGTGGLTITATSTSSGFTDWSIVARDSGGSDIVSAAVSTAPDFRTIWHGYAISIDTTTQQLQIFSDTGALYSTTGSGGGVTWSSTNAIAFFPGVDQWVIGPVTGGTLYGVDLSDFWFGSTASFFDLAVRANQEKLFCGPGAPEHWGTPTIPAATVVIALTPPNPTIFDTTPLGTTVATISLTMSDSSMYLGGAPTFVAPDFDDGGRFIITGSSSPYNLVLNPSGPGLPLSMSIENITLAATQPGGGGSTGGGTLLTGSSPAVFLEGNHVTYPGNLGTGGPAVVSGNPLTDIMGPAGVCAGVASNAWYQSFSVGDKFTSFAVDSWDGNYEIFDVQMPVDITFEVDFGGSPIPGCETAPSTDVTLTFQNITAGTPTTVGTLTIATGATTGAFHLASPLTVFAGDRLRLYAPSAVDTTITGLFGTIVGTR